jgi:calcium/calmodulin-dependent protein kinase I
VGHPGYVFVHNFISVILTARLQYMAPEIFKKIGHGKPVDIWAMGVITYFLLSGYTPFDRDNAQEEMQAICAGDYKFDPEYWHTVSDTAKDFVRTCLTMDAAKRPTAKQLLEHSWLASIDGHFVPDPDSPTGGPTDLLPQIQKAFNARKVCAYLFVFCYGGPGLRLSIAVRRAILSVVATRRMTSLAHSFTNEQAKKLDHDVRKFKEESEQVRQ